MFETRESWLTWRHQGLGSSDAPVIMGTSPWKTRRELWAEKLLPAYIDTPQNYQMARGVALEPIARHKFQTWYSSFKTPVELGPRCMEHPKYPFLKVSLDAANLNGSVNLFAEIKFQGRKEFHWQHIPEKYYWQVIHQFMVTGAGEAYFVGISNEEEIKVLEVPRNENDIETLLHECKQFWNLIQNRIEPSDWE